MGTRREQTLAKIRSEILTLKGQLTSESLKLNPNLWKETYSLEGVKRAILVSAVQEHTILFIGPEAERCVALADQVGVASEAFSHPVVIYNMDFPQELRKQMRRHAIHCEAPIVPQSHIGKPGGTSLKSVIDRVAAAMRNLPKVEGVNPEAEKFLSLAASQIGAMTLTDRNNILSVAQSIAALSESRQVDTTCVAEAVQYWLNR